MDIAFVCVLCVGIGVAVGLVLGEWLDRQDAKCVVPLLPDVDCGVLQISQPPFMQNARVYAERDTLEIPRNAGELCGDVDMCLAGTVYRSTACVWWPHHGWVVRISDNWFCAEDFILTPATGSSSVQPFFPGDMVYSEFGASDYTEDMQLSDNARVVPMRHYPVAACIRRSDGGWFVEIGTELHLAEDFLLVSTHNYT